MKFIKKHPYLFCELLGVIVIVVTILATIIISTDDRTVGNLIENYATYITIGNYILYIAVIELIVSPIIIKLVRSKEKIESKVVIFSKTPKGQIRRKHSLTILIGIAFVILSFKMMNNLYLERQGTFFDTLINEEDNINCSAYTYISGLEPVLIKDGEIKHTDDVRRFGIRGRSHRYSYYIQEDLSHEKIMIILLPTEFERPIYSSKKIEGVTRKIDDELKERILEASEINGLKLTKEDFGNKVADVYLDTSRIYTTKANVSGTIGIISIAIGFLFLILTIIDIVRVKKLEL